MASKTLQEGILDVKIPRGSENRKLWKAWRRQWIGFSVVYPSGRREPYLTLKLSCSPKEIPGNSIKISRDGLRLFRCRSKSRPYRTWSIMSGSKPLLFFAAETEVRAQEWMQSVRDGLWPPCFSFQMLTACSHEVSLIDDDNTFRSGLLGVYGRMVLTSEDVISLMHPHWGATLLQVPLGSIQDVRLVRFAEIPPAGVFSIELKKLEKSTARTFTFYSTTATDAVQWILSKVFSKAAEEDGALSRNETSSKINNQNFGDPNFPITSLPYSTVENSANVLIDITDTEYEIPISLNKTSVRNGISSQESGSFTSVIRDLESVKLISKPTLTIQTNECLDSKDIISNKQIIFNKDVSNSDSPKGAFFENSSCEKVITSTTVPETTSHEIQDQFYNFNSNEYATVNKNYFSKTEVNFSKSPNGTFKSSENYVINKIYNSKESGQAEWTAKYQPNETLKNESYDNFKSKKLISCDIPSSNSNDFLTFECVKPNLLEKNFICSKMTTPPIPSDNTGENPISTLNSQICSDLKRENSSLVAPDSWNSGTYAKLNKQYMSQNFSNHTLNSHSFTKESSVVGNSEVSFPDYYSHLRNISSDLLDTSINFRTLKSTNDRSEFENNEEFLPSSINYECNDLEFASNIYEHLLERKGTVYEDIDDSDNEFELQLPPTLPERPSKLEIPDSLRLQKLSTSINETLKVMKTPPSERVQYLRPNFVKKIKETGRIMHVGPSQEITSELSFMKTLQTENKNTEILKPSVKKAEIQAETISKSCSNDTS